MQQQKSDWKLPSDAQIPGLACFRELLVPRILAFESFRQVIEKGSGADAALHDVAALSHKIAGVAAALEYPGTGDHAATVETTIRRGLAAGQTVAEIWLTALPLLDLLLDDMERILDE